MQLVGPIQSIDFPVSLIFLILGAYDFCTSNFLMKLNVKACEELFRIDFFLSLHGLRPPPLLLLSGVIMFIFTTDSF